MRFCCSIVFLMNSDLLGEGESGRTMSPVAGAMGNKMKFHTSPPQSSSLQSSTFQFLPLQPCQCLSQCILLSALQVPLSAFPPQPCESLSAHPSFRPSSPPQRICPSAPLSAFILRPYPSALRAPLNVVVFQSRQSPLSMHSFFSPTGLFSVHLFFNLRGSVQCIVFQ